MVGQPSWVGGELLKSDAPIATHSNVQPPHLGHCRQLPLDAVLQRCHLGLQRAHASLHVRESWGLGGFRTLDRTPEHKSVPTC